jgi:hypothetical protein
MNNNPNEQRIAAWVERLEERAGTLIDGANLDELSAKERLDLAVKFLSLTQRFISLAMQAQSNTTQGHSDILLTTLMRHMRGESDLVAGEVYQPELPLS